MAVPVLSCSTPIQEAGEGAAEVTAAQSTARHSTLPMRMRPKKEKGARTSRQASVRFRPKQPTMVLDESVKRVIKSSKSRIEKGAETGSPWINWTSGL